MKQPELLTIKSIVKGNHKTFYEFIEKEYSVSVDNLTGLISCTCFMGSNMGINKESSCKHKREVIRYLNNKNDK